MALALGTNVGFCAVAPTADPAGTGVTSDGSSFVVKDTAPTGAIKITEVGWYKSAGTTSSNTQVGLYSADGATVPGEAGTRLQVTGDRASGTSANVWIRFTGLNWPVTAGTVYWLGMQQDAHTGSSNIDTATSGGSGIDTRTSQTALTNPYGGGALGDTDGMYAIYAVYQTAPTVALSSPADSATGVSTTPDLVFTGTDASSDDVRYEVQVDTVNTFDSGSAELEDNFNDNSIDATKWDTYTINSCSTSETSNKAVVTPANSTDGSEGGYRSHNTYNFSSGKEVQVQLVQAASSGVYTEFKVQLTAEVDYISFGVNDAGNLFSQFMQSSSSTVLDTVAYNSSTHKYLKIVNTGLIIQFYYSTDGVSWTLFSDSDSLPSFSLNGVIFAMQVYENGSIGSPGSAQFDNFAFNDKAFIDAVSGTDAGFANPDNTVTDNFNRSNENPIGGNWTNDALGEGADNQLKIVSNQLQAVTAGTSCEAYWNAQTFTGAIEQYFTVVTKPGSGQRVEMGFIQNPGNPTGWVGYQFSWNDVSGAGNDTLTIDRVDAGPTGVTLASGTVEYSAGDVIAFSKSSSGVFKAWKNGVVVLTTAADTTYTGAFYAYVGIRDTTGVLDNWGVQDLDPFFSGEAINYTVQSALSNSTVYYWRVRGIDPSGSNTYGAWATTRSFTTSGTASTGNFFSFFR